jgi:hypothetical protein
MLPTTMKLWLGSIPNLRNQMFDWCVFVCVCGGGVGVCVCVRNQILDVCGVCVCKRTHLRIAVLSKQQHKMDRMCYIYIMRSLLTVFSTECVLIRKHLRIAVLSKQQSTIHAMKLTVPGLAHIPV